MKTLPQFFYAFFIIITLLSSNAEASMTVKVDGKNNCCSSHEIDTKECYSNASSIDLQPGKYIIKPQDGAISKHASDWKARKNKKEPWLWIVIIDVGGEKYLLGSEAYHNTRKAALLANQRDEIKIEIKSKTTVYFWVEDMWKNKNTCHDNREAMIVGVEKI